VLIGTGVFVNKSTYWAFQHEWRYIMTFFSVDFSGGVDSIANSFTINANKMAEGTLPPPIDFWDLSIQKGLVMRIILLAYSSYQHSQNLRFSVPVRYLWK